MRLFRNPAFIAAVAISAVVLMYIALIVGQASLLWQSGEVPGRLLAVALMAPPLIGAWWLYHEWKLGVSAQQMGDALEARGSLPEDDAERNAAGRLTEDAATALFEAARRDVEETPDDWKAWFLVSRAYELNRDRSMARRALRHAAELYKREQAAA